MAAPLLSSFASSRKNLKHVILAELLIVVALFCATFLPFNTKTQFDVVSSSQTAIKLLTIVTLCLHAVVHWVILPNKRDQKFKLSFVLKDIGRCLCAFAISILVIHGIAVLFGAPFFEQTAETFHFAMISAAATVGTALIHFGTSVDTWMRVFIFQNMEHGIESMVFFSTICSVLGSWFGAFPIPLDWDRPWQVWPITCVLGTVLGHGTGALLSALYLCQLYYRGSKYKHI